MAKRIKFFGAMWCADCRRARHFLDKQKIKYEYLNTDKDSQIQKEMLRLNGGIQNIPTLVFPDGSFLIEPTNTELSEKLGIIK